MISGSLSSIKIGEFLIQFEFDSGDSIAAYDGIIFRDAAGKTLSVIDAQSMANILIPAKDYLGRNITRIDAVKGKYCLCFDAGYKIEIVRAHSSHEIGLVSVGQSVEEIF
jgi:hypothetical protein